MENSNLYINYKQENPIYSPGIGTYSMQGNDGEKGDNGNSVYFYPNVINGNTQAKEFIISSIKENKLLYSIYNNDNPHDYLINDIIIDSGGDVYTIKKDASLNWDISDCIGNISPVCPLCVKATINDDNTIILKWLDDYDSDTIQEEYIFNISYLNNTTYETLYDVSINNKLNISTSGNDNIYVEICSKTTGICSKYILKVQ